MRHVPTMTSPANKFRSDDFKPVYRSAHERIAARRDPNWGRCLRLGLAVGIRRPYWHNLPPRFTRLRGSDPCSPAPEPGFGELRLSNVRLKHADGLIGLPEASPFDAIILAAATPNIPTLLLDQLAIGGRMIFPKGTQQQYLCVIERNSLGYTEIMLEEVRFVPILPGILKR